MKNIALIADRTFKTSNDSDITGNELEMISDDYFYEIKNALVKLCENVYHYQSPKEFIDNIKLHTFDLVFTIYGGSNSRNRMALIPAICESYNIRFAGADTYARILCQDKFLSKVFARRYNILSPAGILVDYGTPTKQIEELKLPLVIKPNFEGSSIGIDVSAKVYTYKKAQERLKLLQSKYHSVLIEEFVSGKEVCICIIGNKENIKLFEVMEVYSHEDECFLYDRLYTAQEKHLSDKILHRSITDELSESQKKDILQLYYALGKMDYMRIDGRINKDGFTLIELTPDAYMGRESSFADAAIKNKKEYEELIAMLIHSALESYHTPYSNYKEN